MLSHWGRTCVSLPPKSPSMQSQLSYVSSKLDVGPQRAGAPEDRATARTFGRIPTYPYIEFPHTVTTTRPRRTGCSASSCARAISASGIRSPISNPCHPARNGVGREIITPQVEHGDILEYHQPERDLRVALSVAYGRGTKPEYWESCGVLFQSKKRQIHDALSFRINQVIG